VRIRDVATGADREIYRDARPSQICRFATLRPKIYCAFGNGVTTDFAEIAPDTGVAEKLASVDGVWIMHEVSPDDSEFFGYNFGKGREERWSRETGQTTSMGEGIYPSSDGKWIWRGGWPAEPRSDPAWRHVGYFRMTPWQRPGPVQVQIAPDGQWLYFHARDAAGNLPEAIRLYQQVAKDYAANRPLAAKALVQAARCYEKLGEGQATKLYEQVARDFSDQVELANTARARSDDCAQGRFPHPGIYYRRRPARFPPRRRYAV
jgi:hypothetical protein